MAYTGFAEFERYLEGFGTRYYGTHNEVLGVVQINTTLWQQDIDAAFDRVNNMLDSIARIPIIPVGTSIRTGSYNPHLVEWNTVDAIYHRLVARHVTEFGLNGLPQWMQDFGSRSAHIYHGLVDEKILLDTDTSFRGIGYPVKGTALSGKGTFHTNWDSGHYRASDFPKTFQFKITGTLDGSRIGQAKFSVSEDNGYSWGADEYVTGTAWMPISNGLEVRWEPFGTGDQCVIGDYWKVTCKPQNIRSAGYRTTARTFPRG